MDEHMVHIRPPVWLPVLVVVLLGGFYVWGKHIETQPDERMTISVTGEGKVSAAPNLAELSFGVQTGPQSSAKLAMTKLTRDMQQIVDAVKKAGIAEEDIRTQGLYLNPMYDWASGRQVLRGYEASQSLAVQVRDLDNVGVVLSVATNAGANQAGGVSFTIEDPEELRSQAREEAVAQAKEKARELADDLGMRLGDIRGFNEGFGGEPPMIPMMRAMATEGGDMKERILPVPSGEQEVVVHVTMTYELK